MTELELSRKSDFSFTPSQLEEFHRRGYAGPFTLYTPEEMMERWRGLRLELLDRKDAVYPHNDASGVTNIANYDRHLDHPFLADHVCRPEIVHRMRTILGRDLLCWRTEFFPKYPGDEGTDWHQADTFANASGKPQIVWPEHADFGGTITVWTAFTESTVENGCLQFIPGTQRTMFYDETKRMHYSPDQIGGKMKNGTRRGFFGYDYRELQIDPNWEPEEAKAVSMVMRPGQFVIFWSTLMHASHAHMGLTKDIRLGFVARYVPTCVRVYPGLDSVEEYGGTISLERFGNVLVSGRDEFGHNRLAATTTRGHAFRAVP